MKKINDPAYVAAAADKRRRSKADLFWPLHLHKIHNGKFRRCIDVGGFKGEYTSMYAGLFEKVETFEPNQKLWDVFNNNTKYHTNITLHKLGVSNYVGSTDFYINDVNEGMSSIVHKYVFELDNSNDFKSSAKINLTTIDSMKFTNVDFIKIDAEGADTRVIQGALKTINAYKPTIQTEMKKKKLVHILEGIGYKKLKSENLQNLSDSIWIHMENTNV